MRGTEADAVGCDGRKGLEGAVVAATEREQVVG